MKKEIASILLFLLCFLPVVAQSAERDPQSIGDLIVLGLEVNLGLQIEKINIPQRTETIEIEKAFFDSELFAATGYDYLSTPFDSSYSSSSESHLENYSAQLGVSKRLTTGLTASLFLDTKRVSDNDYYNNLDPSYRTTLMVDLNQPLLRNLGTSINTTNIEISRNQLRQESLTYLLQAQSLILQLESVARQLAAKTQIIQLRQEAYDLANELYLANKKRFAAGSIPVSEVQEAETSLAGRQLSLSLAIQNRDILQEDLNRQLNHKLSKEFKPATLVDFNLNIKPTEFPDFKKLFESAQQKRLELKINDYSIQSSVLQKNYLHNQLKPQLDLNLQLGLNGFSGHERTSALASQYSGNWMDSLSSMGDADGYQVRAGLEFSMPIGNRSAKSRYRQAELQLKKEHYQQKDLESLIESELLQQQINVSHATEQLKITEHFEALAKKTFKQEQRRLEEGLSDTFRMILFQQAMIEAKIDRIDSITQYYMALAKMEFATGNIFERHNIVLSKNAEELNLENI